MKICSVHFDVLGPGSRSRCRLCRSSETQQCSRDGRQQWICLSDSSNCFYEITLFPEPARRLLIVYRRSDVPKPGHHKDVVSAVETQVLNSKDCKNQPAECGVLFSLRTRCLRSKSWG